jgi:hypothetical protein
VLAIRDSYDAVIIAGFSEPGREGLQELVAQPVIDTLSWLDVVSGLSRSAEDAGTHRQPTHRPRTWPSMSRPATSSTGSSPKLACDASRTPPPLRGC